MIINRAENNLTAKVLINIFNASRLSEKGWFFLDREERKDARLELFWKGFRDYTAEAENCREHFIREYEKIVPRARSAVEKTRLRLQDGFYSVQDKDKIFNELRNTEIDAVIFTGRKICLVEAKRKEKPGCNGRNILAHQLVRQRVMVEVLKALQGDRRRVCTFIICDESKLKSIQRTEQLKALQYMDNALPGVLSWQELLEKVPQTPEISALRGEVEEILSGR